MDELVKLNAERRRINMRISKIEDEKRVAENQNLVGQCFKYLNSYSGGRPKWWLYAKVTHLREGGHPNVMQFQTDCDGRVEIQPSHDHYSLLSGYEPISNREFNGAWRRMQKCIAGMKPTP